MGKIKIDPYNCVGCHQAVDSVSSGEVWHEACYQEHVAELDGERCSDHAVCSREAQRKKNQLKELWAQREQSRVD